MIRIVATRDKKGLVIICEVTDKIRGTTDNAIAESVARSQLSFPDYLQ